MTLLDAQEFDAEKARKKKRRIILIVVVMLVLLSLGWWFRYWPQEHIVGKFFDALQKQDFNTAYGIWMHDPEWKQHPAEHSKYPFNEFYRDWGPGGEWGLVNNFKIDGSDNPGSGVVVVVTVNQRAEKARLWVEKSDKTLTFSPY